MSSAIWYALRASAVVFSILAGYFALRAPLPPQGVGPVGESLVSIASVELGSLHCTVAVRPGVQALRPEGVLLGTRAGPYDTSPTAAQMPAFTGDVSTITLMVHTQDVRNGLWQDQERVQ